MTNLVSLKQYRNDMIDFLSNKYSIDIDYIWSEIHLAKDYQKNCIVIDTDDLECMNEDLPELFRYFSFHNMSHEFIDKHRFILGWS